MPVASGIGSYMCPAMQTAFGSAAVPTITLAHLRTGAPYTPRQQRRPRISTAKIMPSAAQLWSGVDLVDFTYDFEITSSVSAWLPLLRASWSKESATAVAPNVRTYSMNDPPVDTGTDAAGPPALSYNHALTIRHSHTSGGTDIDTIEMRDCCVNEFYFSCAADETFRYGISGTGQNFQDATMVAFSEPVGTPYAWNHLIAGANSGIYSGTANPPTTAMPVKSFKFTVNNNLRFQPFLGNATGLELKLPCRNGYPTAMVEYEMDFDNVSTTDAVTLMTDYHAATNHNIRIEAYIDANSSLELLASGSTAPGIIDSPVTNVGSEGPVSFTFRQLIYPNTLSTDLTMVLTTAS